MSVYEALPGRAPAGAYDAADEMLPREHRFSDEERARPALTWLHQQAAPRRSGERSTGPGDADPPRRMTGPTDAGSAVAPASIAVVVENDDVVRGIAAAMLEETDFDVIVCDSAAAALAAMREHGSNVALLFTELELPGGMDGVTLARAVERDWPDVRLVVTSRPGAAQAVPDHAVYMPKPWRPADMAAAMTNLRRLRSA